MRRVSKALGLLLGVIGLSAAGLLLRPDGAAGEPCGRRGNGGWQRWLIANAKRFAALLALLAAGGFLVAVSGVIPIKASSGHWPITAWFLNFSMERSVSTHTIGMDAPPLDDPALVLRGAGHYETACRPCHGSPDLRRPRIAAAMTPHPPYLPPEIPKWDSAELFYIVKHGVKFTGMPAWPTQERDDEVWAMVAFLREFADMDAAEYRRLARGEVDATGLDAPIQDLTGPDDAPEAITQSCGRCHGLDGLGRGTGAFPKLAGQSPVYLEASLVAYARGERHSGFMEPLAVGLSPEDVRAITRYYAGLDPPASPATPYDPAAVERGKAIALRGVPERRVPACVACHGPGDLPRNPLYPALAGQYADYLVQQLELFKKGHRGGTPYAHLMHSVASRLTTEQMRDAAAYYESLSPDPDLAAP
ncbi:MAG TPA: c-type cytochrome [Planctomycetaceae bacterium]